MTVKTAGITSPITAYLEELHARFKSERGGAVADYIPELAKVDEDGFGIAVATIDGHVYEAGDSQREFTIQSMSKPFTYGLAIADQGLDTVLSRIGVEPTGDAFNSISLEAETGRPLNPMINAGAIAAASMVAGHSQEDRNQRLLATYSMYAGRPLAVDMAVFESESETGHRNRAIAHMLRNFDILQDPDSALDVYFRQCSVNVTSRDLSLMAATLANNGTHPITGDSPISPTHVQQVLSVMTTCGLYDAAGDWFFHVGLPAKSGVGGGIFAVLPGQLGIGVYSPRLDEHGNSVRGLAACKTMAYDLGLHVLKTSKPAASAVRSAYNVSQVRSRRVRNNADRDVLKAHGHSIRVFELQGDVFFATLEPLVRQVVEMGAELEVVILDLRRVSSIDPTAFALFKSLIQQVEGSGKRLLLSSVGAHTRLMRYLEEQQASDEISRSMLFCPDLDVALEHGEDMLISRQGKRKVEKVSVAENLLCQGLSEHQVSALEALLEDAHFKSGEYIVHQGDAANALFLLLEGEATVAIGANGGKRKRLSTITAGMHFGDVAVYAGGVRSADVVANTPLHCKALSQEAFARLSQTHPDISIVILQNLLKTSSQVIGRLNKEMAAYVE